WITPHHIGSRASRQLDDGIGDTIVWPRFMDRQPARAWSIRARTPGSEVPDRIRRPGAGVWSPRLHAAQTGDLPRHVRDQVRARSGRSGPRPVLDGPDDTDPIAWTRDGRLVFQGSDPSGAYPLKLCDPRNPAEITHLTEQHVDNGGSLSPDDRWLAYRRS